MSTLAERLAPHFTAQPPIELAYTIKCGSGAECALLCQHGFGV